MPLLRHNFKGSVHGTLLQRNPRGPVLAAGFGVAVLFSLIRSCREDSLDTTIYLIMRYFDRDSNTTKYPISTISFSFPYIVLHNVLV